MAVTRKRKADAESNSGVKVGEDNKSTKKARKEQKNEKLQSDETKHKPDSSRHDKDDEESGEIITINRAPVLELWTACLAQSQYSDLAWNTCLSVGGAVSTLCAISKGRAIGAIDKPDEEMAEKKRQERESKTTTDEIHVMRFNVKLDKGIALAGSKPKKANESALKHKFGEDGYKLTKETFEQAISSWKDDIETLNSKAFHMYEQFRPSVPKGQRGWGRQGQLKLQSVRDVVTKT